MNEVTYIDNFPTNLLQAINSVQGVILFSLDRNYRYTAFSNSHKVVMQRIWGADIQVGDCMLDFLSEEDREKAKQNFDSVLSGSQLKLLEEYGDSKLNRSFWENHYDPIYDENKNIVGLVVFVVDVSEQMKLLKELQETKDRLNLALHSGNIGVWEWFVRSDSMYWSEHFYDILGVDKRIREVSFDLYKSRIHPEDLQSVLATIEQSLQTLGEFQVLHRVATSDQSVKWVLVYGKIFVNESGKPVRMLGTSQDISRLMQIEEDLKIKNQKLIQINENLDRFVYSASHDLRAPIASLLGLIQIVKQEHDLTNIKKLMEMQEGLLHKLDNFTNDLLEYYRNQKLGADFEIIDFESLVQESFELFSFMDGGSEIYKNLVIRQSHPFYSDPRRLKVVFNNLISNAIKYADKNKDNRYLLVEIESNEKQVRVMIKDNGEGIKQTSREHLFNMFYRASDRGKGSGLGLFIVKETLDKLNGSIECESVEGVGTTFTICIPNKMP